MDKKELEQLLNTRVSSQAVDQNDVNKNFSKEATDNANINPQDVLAEVEKMAKNDLDTIRSLMSSGIVSRQQGQNLMTEVIENAYKSITTQNELQPEAQNTTDTESLKDVFAEFEKSNPDFFKRKGREDVLAYLKNSNVNFDRDELLQISKLIEAIEQNAIERYLQKVEYGKTLNDENTVAKQKLTANAQNSNANDNNMVFTRSQIGKMSGDEFAKYESLIMEQMRKGLIH